MGLSYPDKAKEGTGQAGVLLQPQHGVTDLKNTREKQKNKRHMTCTMSQTAGDEAGVM